MRRLLRRLPDTLAHISNCSDVSPTAYARPNAQIMRHESRSRLRLDRRRGDGELHARSLVGGAMTWFKGRGAGKLKYGNVPVREGGAYFSSTGEFKRWCELKLLEKAGQIFDLKRQVPFDLTVNTVNICKYVADFTYRDHGIFGGALIVEDYKSAATKTPIFDIKRKLMMACHGIDVRLTGKGVAGK